MEQQKHLSFIPEQAAGFQPEMFATLRDSSGRAAAEAHAYRAGSFHFNWNSFLDVTQVQKGSIRLHTEEGVFDASEDMFAIINPNVGHAALSLEQDTLVLVLAVSEEYLKQSCGFLPIFQNPCGREPLTSPLSHLIRAAATSFALAMASGSSEKQTQLFSRSQIDLLLSLFLKYFPGRGAGANQAHTLAQRQKIQELIQFIDENYQHPLSLSLTADRLGINPSYLSAFFRKNTGLGFHEYLIRKRLAHAVRLLNHTESPILDIALESGFSDLKPFYAAFQKYLKLSPGKYRDSLRSSSCRTGSSSMLPLTFEPVAAKLRSLASRPVSFPTFLQEEGLSFF